MTKLYFFTHKVFKHISKTLISLISILQAVKSANKTDILGKNPVRIRKFRTTVRIRVFTDRASTNQSEGFFKAI